MISGSRAERTCVCFAGGGRVQHRERPPGADSSSEDHGVLREEGEADRAAQENVSFCSFKDKPEGKGRGFLLKMCFSGSQFVKNVYRIKKCL